MAPSSHTLQDPLGTTHLPEDVDVNTPTSTGHFMRDLCLGDGSVDGEIDELFVPALASPA